MTPLRSESTVQNASANPRAIRPTAPLSKKPSLAIGPLHVGMDVSAQELALCYRQGDAVVQRQTVANTPESHKALCTHLRKYAEVKVVLEATGVYHFNVAIALSDAGIPVMVANPRATANYAKATLSNTKTDRADALLLAKFAQNMAFIPWQRPSQNALHLSQLARRITQMAKIRTAETNRLHALNSMEASAAFLVADVEEHIASLQQRIKNLLQAARQIIQSDPLLQRRFEGLHSIPGFGVLTAVLVLAHVAFMPEGLTAKQWVKMAGLDPTTCESGTSIKRKGRVSKTGNKYLRHALFMPALVASHRNIHIKAYYQHLLQDLHKQPKQALIAVMRKLVHAMHAVIKYDTPFIGEKFFNRPKIATISLEL